MHIEKWLKEWRTCCV